VLKDHKSPDTLCGCGRFGTGWYSMVRFRINAYVASACFSPGRGNLCLDCARQDGARKVSAKTRMETKPMEIEVGQEYDIIHSRKGSFRGKILFKDAESCEVEITCGAAHGMAKAWEKGEKLMIRMALAKFTAAKKL
jgi:hypothetical protein